MVHKRVSVLLYALNIIIPAYLPFVRRVLRMPLQKKVQVLRPLAKGSKLCVKVIEIPYVSAYAVIFYAHV